MGLTVEDFLAFLDGLLKGGKGRMLIRILAGYVQITEKAQQAIRGWSCAVKFSLAGEKPFYLLIRDGQASVRETWEGEANLVVEGEPDAFFKALAGDVNAEEALARLRADGSAEDALKLVRLVEVVMEENRGSIEMLKRLLPKA